MSQWSERYSDLRLAAYISLLKRLPTGRLLDLGAGHGAFSRAADNLGWSVTALDARDARFPADLRDRVEFRLSLVEDLEWDSSEFDLICCLGLFYHLTYEMQERLLTHVEHTPLLLETHYATGDAFSDFSPRLSDWRVHDGILGREYPEVPQLDAESRKETGLLASFENDVSFWPTQRSLREQLRRHGYTFVWELAHDFEPAQRTFFLALPAD